jgi:S-DNA-T family DNA segregation ATPase FtsK/SpoIIIE
MLEVDESTKKGYDAYVPVEKLWSKLEDGTIDGNFCIPLGVNEKHVDVCIDINSAPHILVAGAPNAGVEMFRNVALATMLKFNKPEDLQFVLIDPLEISFSNFKNIDEHLGFTIITERDKAIKALEWANEEVEKRYTAFFNSKVMNVDEYNQKNPKNTLQKVVIIITELSELVGYPSANHTEDLIIHLLQKSRNAGFHLILNTTNPDRKALPDLLIANIFTKIAFRTRNKKESRAILDFQTGAEKLLGQGDMLVSMPPRYDFQRMQGYYLAEDLIED